MDRNSHLVVLLLYIKFISNARNDKNVSRSTITLALYGIKFFYERTLQRQWTTLASIRPQREKKLPVMLSVDEVRQILARVQGFPPFTPTEYGGRGVQLS